MQFSGAKAMFLKYQRPEEDWLRSVEIGQVEWGNLEHQYRLHKTIDSSSFSTEAEWRLLQFRLSVAISLGISKLSKTYLQRAESIEQMGERDLEYIYQRKVFMKIISFEKQLIYIAVIISTIEQNEWLQKVKYIANLAYHKESNIYKYRLYYV